MSDATGKLLFGVSLHLGTCSNNYAEYAAVILAELFGALLNQPSITINSDSKLMVEQVKGNYKVKNKRLIELVKITHALAFRF